MLAGRWRAVAPLRALGGARPWSHCLQRGSLLAVTVMPLSIHERMKRVRQHDTAPEMAVRSLLHRAGLRFRLCPKDLPGRPDLANRRARWAVFVHGCFWHAHAGCHLATVPKSNRPFWIAKFAANRRRDARKVEALRDLGYNVAIVWQCELADRALLRRVLRELALHRRSTRTPSK
jgi:DNA mismatch endonuclease, patch repair protein